MAKYRKRPIVVEAEQWWPGKEIEGVFVIEPQTREPGWAYVKTRGGNLTVYPGDWVIRNSEGELHLCNPDVFGAIYEEIE